MLVISKILSLCYCPQSHGTTFTLPSSLYTPKSFSSSILCICFLCFHFLNILKISVIGPIPLPHLPAHFSDLLCGSHTVSSPVNIFSPHSNSVMCIIKVAKGHTARKAQMRTELLPVCLLYLQS